jgi:hypothetical protein
MTALEKIRWVNEDRVIANAMPLLFQKGWPVIAELVQNAQRAGSTQVRIRRSPEDACLIVEDDGEGIADIDALIRLFIVGESGFSDAKVAQQRPAGMGFYALLAGAKKVKVASQFGSLMVESRKWFHHAGYRDRLLARVDAVTRRLKGIRLEATGIDEPLRQLADEHIRSRLAGYTQLQVVYNDEVIAPYDPAQHYRYCVEVDGVEAWWWLKAGADTHPSPALHAENHYTYAWVNWYGHLIPARIHAGHQMYLVVRQGYPFNPKLPDREALLEDECWAAFKRRLGTAICQFICNLPLETLAEEPRLVEMACGMDAEYFHAHAPAGVFWHLTGTRDEIEEPRYQYDALVLPKAQIVRTIGNTAEDIECKIRTKEGTKAPFDLFSGYRNSHLFGKLAEQGHELLLHRQVPDAMQVLKPSELWVELEGVETQYESLGVWWARQGSLVVQYEDGVEVRYDLDGQLLMHEECNIWDLEVIVVGAQPVEVLEDNRDWLFFYHSDWDTDSYETQRERFGEDFDALIDRMTGKVPLLKALRNAGVGKPEDIAVISLGNHEPGCRTAAITFRDGTMKTVRVR